MVQATTLLGITTGRMDTLIMLGRIGGIDTGDGGTGGIIEDSGGHKAAGARYAS